MHINSTTATARLFAAADALLAAMQQGGTVPLTLANHISSQSPRGFTPSELMNAMDMLIRMGFATRRD